MFQIKLNIPETTAAIAFNYITKEPDGTSSLAGMIVDAMTLATGEVTLAERPRVETVGDIIEGEDGTVENPVEDAEVEEPETEVPDDDTNQ